jgi:hypothetical protein
VGFLRIKTVTGSPVCPIALHVVGVFLAPLLLTVAALLSINGIFNELFPMVVCAAAALAIS